MARVWERGELRRMAEKALRRGKYLGPMPGQQEIARAKNACTHLTEAFAVGEPAVGGPFHPGMESVRIARLDFFISESFEVSKMDFRKVIESLDCQPVRFGDNPRRLHRTAESTSVNVRKGLTPKLSRYPICLT